uniref:Cupin type-1 domain-containing protein n=1 Tax=Musa acuminata subsp. malaccensis TaxID=214687 RepID=A0A804K8U8_MUSAM|nr:PREDICTED: globulin-1 S allele-like [Musa acuminata subsp. malaccensis]
MAIRRVEAFLFPLLLLLLSSSCLLASSSKSDPEKKRCVMECRGIPEQQQRKLCEYHGAAGRNPQTFYTSFSNEVLEAAFNTPWDKLGRVFRSQRKGEIIKITEDQIRALNESKTESWPFGLSNEPYNLLENNPSHSNEHGQIHEATGNECEMLQDLNVDVSIANISERSMMAPNYDTRSTKLAMVVEGRGYIEMACPHRSAERRRTQEESGSQGEQRVRYRTVRSRVSRGSVFVIPAGHPAAVVAAANENLQVLCFGIRSENNRRYYLAGRNNVLNRLDRAAKAMAFGVPAEEVEEVLNAQPESVFMPGPERRREEEEKRRQLVFKYAGF